MRLCPVTLKEARRFVNLHHRRHKAPQCGKYAIGLSEGNNIIGVIIVGRPVARHMDDGWTAEATRCAVLEGHPNGCSMLYAAAWRADRAMGYRRLITYTAAPETGTSLRASGFRAVHQTRPQSWHREDRPRVNAKPLEQKTLWELTTG